MTRRNFFEVLDREEKDLNSNQTHSDGTATPWSRAKKQPCSFDLRCTRNMTHSMDSTTATKKAEVPARVFAQPATCLAVVHFLPIRPDNVYFSCLSSYLLCTRIMLYLDWIQIGNWCVLSPMICSTEENNSSEKDVFGGLCNNRMLSLVVVVIPVCCVEIKSFDHRTLR